MPALIPKGATERARIGGNWRRRLLVAELAAVALFVALLLRGFVAPAAPAAAPDMTAIRYRVDAGEWPQGTTLSRLADRYGGDLAAMRSVNPAGAGCADPNAPIQPGDSVTIVFSSAVATCDEGGLDSPLNGPTG
jgi:hypothetical protein